MDETPKDGTAELIDFDALRALDERFQNPPALSAADQAAFAEQDREFVERSTSSALQVAMAELAAVRRQATVRSDT